MTRGVRFQIRDGVAFVTLDGAQEAPQGAGLTAALRVALAEALEVAFATQGLKAVVLRAGAGGWPRAAHPAEDYAVSPGVPALADLTERLAHAPVPVVALLSGEVSGGALALSQAAGLRLAPASARFHCPEFAQGLLPAAGALVRMVRRAGPEAVLPFVLSGGAVQGNAALALGLCDAVLGEGAAEAAALGEALRVAALGAAAPLAPRDGALENPGPALDALAKARLALPGGAMAAPAARLAEVVEAALLLPFEAALAFEAVAYEDLSRSQTALALRHLAMARAAAAAGLAGVEGAAPVERLMRLALWNQPERLAAALLARGLTVRLGASEPLRLEATVTAIAQLQEGAVQAGRISAARREADWARLEPVAGSADLWAGEAVPDLVLASPADAADLVALRAARLPGVPLALGGGAVPQPDEMGFARAGGATCLWPGSDGQDADLRRLAAVLRLEGGAVVHGHALGLRLEAAWLAAAERTVLAGASPQAVDAALCAWGFEEGPFARLDRLGLGAVQPRLATVGFTPGPFLLWLGLEGRMGRGGRGVYDPLPLGAARPVAGDAAALASLRQEAGLQGAVLDGAEIVARVLAELAGAGAAALQQRAAHRAADIDLMAVAALGFPRHHGGPMFQADRMGILALRKRLRSLEQEGGPPPSGLLDVMIRNGRRFAELSG